MEMGNTTRSLPAYDENGNIRSMKQKGLKLGSSSVIDELEYDYHQGGNKLKYVKDWAADASGTVGGNWGLGDFTDKNTGDVIHVNNRAFIPPLLVALLSYTSPPI
jgi:hypothetical protein